MPEPLKIGSEIWTINPRDRRQGWERHVISGETRLSWLVGSRKIVKATMLENHGRDWGSQRWYSAIGYEARRIVDANCRRLSQKVSDLDYGDPDVIEVASKLERIAEILGERLL